jgi:hypothetical protein
MISIDEKGNGGEAAISLLVPSKNMRPVVELVETRGSHEAPGG